MQFTLQKKTVIWNEAYDLAKKNKKEGDALFVCDLALAMFFHLSFNEMNSKHE